MQFGFLHRPTSRVKKSVKKNVYNKNLHELSEYVKVYCKHLNIFDICVLYIYIVYYTGGQKCSIFNGFSIFFLSICLSSKFFARNCLCQLLQKHTTSKLSFEKPWHREEKKTLILFLFLFVTTSVRSVYIYEYI